MINSLPATCPGPTEAGDGVRPRLAGSRRQNSAKIGRIALIRFDRIGPPMLRPPYSAAFRLPGSPFQRPKTSNLRFNPTKTGPLRPLAVSVFSLSVVKLRHPNPTNFGLIALIHLKAPLPLLTPGIGRRRHRLPSRQSHSSAAPRSRAPANGQARPFLKMLPPSRPPALPPHDD